jgi:hypothetical protein
VTTPIAEAYDPTATIRDLYRQAETDLLSAVAEAVEATIEQPATGPLNEARLRRRTRALVAALDVAVRAEADVILDAAPLEGRALAEIDTSD